MPRTTQNQPKTKADADVIISVSMSALLDKVFGTRENPTTPEERTEIIPSLTLNEQMALSAYLDSRAQEFHEISRMSLDEIQKHPKTDFPSENCLSAVQDSDTGEDFGAISVTTEIKTSYSTQEKGTRPMIVAALKSANLYADPYVRISEELQTKALFRDKAKGVLPPSVATLLTATEKEKRTAVFQKLASPSNQED